MTIEEAIKKAEKQISQYSYTAETTRYPGISKINSTNATWLSMILHYAKKALWDQEERENPKQLTLEELVKMDAPVWAGHKEGPGGFWCLCQKGCIITPSGQAYGADELHSWIFYRHKPKGE